MTTLLGGPGACSPGKCLNLGSLKWHFLHFAGTFEQILKSLNHVFCSMVQWNSVNTAISGPKKSALLTGFQIRKWLLSMNYFPRWIIYMYPVTNGWPRPPRRVVHDPLDPPLELPLHGIHPSLQLEWIQQSLVIQVGMGSMAKSETLCWR